MARKKAVKKQTLNEFQSWLQGITEIQPVDWTPDADQWKMIYERIVNIKEQVAPKAAETASTVHVQPYIPPNNPYVAPPVPAAMPHINPAEIEMTEAAKKALAGSVDINNPAPAPIPVASSDGNLQSSFE